MWPFLTAIGLALIAMWVQQRKDATAAKLSAEGRDKVLNQIKVNVDGNLSKALAKIDRLEEILEKNVDNSRHSAQSGPDNQN